RSNSSVSKPSSASTSSCRKAARSWNSQASTARKPRRTKSPRQSRPLPKRSNPDRQQTKRPLEAAFFRFAGRLIRTQYVVERLLAGHAFFKADKGAAAIAVGDRNID